MNKKILLFALTFCSLGFAQETDKAELKKLANKFQAEYIINQHYVDSVARAKGVNPSELKKHFLGKSGNFLVYIEDLDNDQILSTNADLLHNGSATGFPVTGLGMTIYQWDGGRVIEDHVEMAGRITNMEEASVEISDHSIGVAGVMIAGGVASNAKGLAPEASVIAYDYQNNFNEIAEASVEESNAAYMLSNHSYGYQAGWRYGEYEESLGEGWYWFGYPHLDENESVMHGIYSNLDQYLDQIARSAPNHLIIKAAGNDRNLGPENATEHAALNENNEWDVYNGLRPVNCGHTGYDCIPYGSMSKNIMVVGSVNQLAGNGRYNGPSSVSPSSFSAFGPTDDGRIKPDVVAQGSSVIIPVSNNSYFNNVNGTSVASPNITGIAALLQQISNQLRDEYLSASELKALILNTTNEVGSNPGPDYRFGFGLIDAFQAANLLVDANNSEAVIFSGTKTATDINLNLLVSGTEPVRATLVWLDPPKNADLLPYVLNSRIPMLVNDLDMRIMNSSQTYMPWTLDVENPSAAAVPGDNVLDNVEQILIPTPQAGNHTLTITHKNNLLSPTQNFALVISGARLLNTGTEDIRENSVSVFPVPAKDVLNISGLTGDAEIQIIDMNGRIVKNEKLNSTALNVQSLESGSYILMITTDEGTTAKKFIKK